MGTTLSLKTIIDKQFVVNVKGDKKSFMCRLCGVLLKSPSGVARHWRKKHAVQQNVSIE